MFGLELISVGLLHLTALETKPVSDQIICELPKPLLIEVVSAQDDVRYDFSKKTAELNKIGHGAYSPYGEGHRNTEFRGLTVGRQSLSHDIKFYFEEFHDERMACLKIQKVKVTMNYAPTVYISTNYKKGTPIFDKILEHEKEHVKITQSVINKYANILQAQLENNLRDGASADLFSIDQLKQRQKELESRVKRIMARVDRAMHKESRRRHNQFDDAELDDTIKYNQGIARRLEKILKIDD